MQKSIEQIEWENNIINRETERPDDYDFRFKKNIHTDLNPNKDLVLIDRLLKEESIKDNIGSFGYHKNFRTALLHCSNEKKDFKNACKEWRVTGYYMNNSYCVCTKDILHCYKIFNIKNNNILDPVGADCVKHIDTKEVNEDMEYYTNYKKIVDPKFDIEERKYCIDCLKFIDKRKKKNCSINSNDIIYNCGNCHNRFYKLPDEIIDIINSLYYDKNEELNYFKKKPNKYNRIMRGLAKQRSIYIMQTIIDYQEYKIVTKQILDTVDLNSYKIKFGKYANNTYHDLISYYFKYCEWLIDNLEYDRNQKMIDYFSCRIKRRTEIKYNKFRNMSR